MDQYLNCKRSFLNISNTVRTKHNVCAGRGRGSTDNLLRGTKFLLGKSNPGKKSLPDFSFPIFFFQFAVYVNVRSLHVERFPWFRLTLANVTHGFADSSITVSYSINLQLQTNMSLFSWTKSPQK